MTTVTSRSVIRVRRPRRAPIGGRGRTGEVLAILRDF